ncbi:MAG TPA: HD domain-containing protein [Ktedonobacteraceae bacterium]|nr:HD domain-containing protein [Ktedonobacteraceae bacterium]
MHIRSLEPIILATIQANIYQEVKKRFASIDDLAHGWEHVQRVYSLALSIAEREGADSFIVGAAALMHDLGRVIPDTTRHHAEVSVTLAGDILDAQSIPPAMQQAILHAIEAHSFSRNIEPRTLEARVVRDADRLDGLGAMGIIRWAITGTIRHTPETLTYHPDDPFAERHKPDDTHYMLDHFYTKLLKLSDTMATPTGREMARHRTVVMQTFLNELRGELASSNT